MAKRTKDLFRKKYPSRASKYASKNLLSSSSDSIGREVESALYTEQFIKDRDRYKPNIDFTDPSNFVRFGSAKEYYEKSIGISEIIKNHHHLNSFFVTSLKKKSIYEIVLDENLNFKKTRNKIDINERIRDIIYDKKKKCYLIYGESTPKLISMCLT